MDNVFPDIWITLDVSQKDFLNRIVTITQSGSGYTSEKLNQATLPLGNLDGVEINSEQESRVRCYIFIDPDRPTIAQIEVQFVSTDDWPSADEYVVEAKQFITALLDEYAQQYQTRLWLDVRPRP